MPSSTFKTSITLGNKQEEGKKRKKRNDSTNKPFIIKSINEKYLIYPSAHNHNYLPCRKLFCENSKVYLLSFSSLPYQAHSFNDLDVAKHLLDKGVKYFKFDASLANK